MRRRDLLRLAGAGTGLGTLGLSGCALRTADRAASARVLVVGGGYGGATAAKYVRLLSGYQIDVVLVEPEPAFVSSPMSNLVLSGHRKLTDITRAYDTLGARHGVRVVTDRVASIDPTQRVAVLASGSSLRYDKLVLSPGVDMVWGEVAGLLDANREGRIFQAWKAGPETAALRRQLEAMPDGGVFAIAIPEGPYGCPSAPYERASLVASYFKAAKPRSKVLVLDAGDDVTGEGPLFKRAWAEFYKGVLEYRPRHKATGVDPRTGTVRFDNQDKVRGDVLNVLPPLRAGAIALQTGLAGSSDRWCDVNWLNFESTAARHIHVIGDALQNASQMPKSGHMANGQAKVLAAAIVAELHDLELDPAPMLTNACYSFVDDKRAMHVASVHAWAPHEKTFVPVAGSGGVSAGANELEAALAFSWARSIWSDTLA